MCNSSRHFASGLQFPGCPSCVNVVGAEQK